MDKNKINLISFLPVKFWPKNDRPREKLIKNGEDKLSDAELLAILLRTGRKGESVIDLAQKILYRFKTFRTMSRTSLLEWKDFKGLGIAKLAQIKAAIEIGKRLFNEDLSEEFPKIKSSQDIADIVMASMRDLRKEVFKVITLSAQNLITGISTVEEGTVNQAHPIIREIFQKALEYGATSIVCVHNHPSGNSSPSEEDNRFTSELYRAGNVLQIAVLDHIIIGNNTYYSFADEGGHFTG
jgi:DNA repair protein RadC